jgi:hypothetical protein
MRILQMVFLIVVLVSEIAIFIWGYRLSKKVFEGLITSIYRQLGISILSGIPVGLLFVIMALIAGILDANFRWTLSAIIGVVSISSILFILGVLGSIWRFFIAGKFRSNLIAKIRNQGK